MLRTLISRLFPIVLCAASFGCAAKLPVPSIPPPYEAIVRIAATMNTAREFDPAFNVQVKTLIGNIDDPIALRQLASALRNYDHQIEHDGRCALCERLNEAAEYCAARLSELKTDAAARELVQLWRDETQQWDGATSVLIGTCITKMRKLALPHLQLLVLDLRFADRAKTYIDCIHRDEDYGP